KQGSCRNIDPVEPIESIIYSQQQGRPVLSLDRLVFRRGQSTTNRVLVLVSYVTTARGESKRFRSGATCSARAYERRYVVSKAGRLWLRSSSSRRRATDSSMRRAA